MSEEPVELINEDLKEKTCLTIAESINRMMETVIEDYEAEAMITYMRDLDVLMHLVEHFKNFCMIEVVEEQ